jgi:small subunit ribosomal protein S17
MPTNTELVIPETSPRRIGIVESDKRNKTRKVVIAYSGKHAKYGKYVRKRTVLHVHDAKNESNVGDRVEIAECRPISRTKRWTVIRVVEKAPAKADMVFEVDTGSKKKK